MQNCKIVIDALKQGVLLLDRSGAIKYFNPSVGKHLDFTEGDIGRQLDELVELYPRKFWREPLAKADVLVRRSGVEQQCLATTHAADDDIVLLLDWERLQVEDEFRFFIMDNMSEAVLLLDEQGGVLYMNNAATVMLRVGLRRGADRYWTLAGLGEFAPDGFWRYPAYKKEILFRKGDDEVHLLASAHHQSDKVILVLEEEKRETLRFIRQDTLATVNLDTMAGIGTELRRQAMVLANSDLSFLVTGESGTGKEVMARAVHYSSVRCKGPFVVIDCTALPEHLVESELFGYEPGSFTGARSEGRAGKFELADGGTIMLDEISELPLAMQPKLLRILNDQMVMRIGARKPKPVNVRVIACTNRDLQAMVPRGQFREDLFYRLKGAVLHLPPLRERMKNLDELLALFLNKYGHGRPYRFSPHAHAVLGNFRWPGNIRELEKAVQFVLAQDPPEEIPGRLLPGDIVHGNPALSGGRLKDAVRQHERALVSAALQAHTFNVTATAATLGLTRMGLAKKIAVLGVKLPGKRAERFPKRMGRGNRAKVEILAVSPATVRRGGEISLRLRVENTGRTPWLELGKTSRECKRKPGTYSLVAVWWKKQEPSAQVAENFLPLPHPLPPGQGATIDERITVSAPPGTYLVSCWMTLNGVGAFLDKPVACLAYSAECYPSVEVAVIE